MRLIDADAFADDLLGYIFERGQASGLWDEQLERDMITYADIEYAKGYDYALEECHRNLIERPTVEAIPIEWIRKYTNHRTAEFGDMWVFINCMINDWEKENASISRE